AEGGDVVVEIIGDGRVPADRHADLGEAQAQPLTVGVEILPAGQLASDGEDFRLHCWSSVHQPAAPAGSSLAGAAGWCFASYSSHYCRRGGAAARMMSNVPVLKAPLAVLVSRRSMIRESLIQESPFW